MRDRMIFRLEDCLAARARLAADDFGFDAFDAEIVAQIERATGRAFEFGAVDGMSVMS